MKRLSTWVIHPTWFRERLLLAAVAPSSVAALIGGLAATRSPLAAVVIGYVAAIVGMVPALLIGEWLGRRQDGQAETR